MPKNIPMQPIKDDLKIYNEKDTVDVKINGKLEEIEFYPYFSPTKINEMMEELKQSLEDQHELGIELDDNLFFPFVYYFTIKKFTTNLSFPKKTKQDIQYFMQFVDHPIYEEVLNSFPEEELGKVFDKTIEVMSAYEKLQNKLKDYQDEIQNMPIENEELRNRIQGKQIPEA